MFLRRVNWFFGLFVLIGACGGVLSSDFESDYPIVEAVAGAHASIPCNVSTPLEDDEATLILWYRLDLPNPIYTLDVRGAALRSARHFPADEMDGRAKFDVAVHPPVLRLEDVGAQDEADYKCRVDLRRSRTLILHSRLRVIEPPSEPIIMDEHGQRLHDVVGPYDEGSSIVFICEVDGGDPSPNVTWWRGAVLLDDSFVVIRQRFVRNELVLRDLARSELMAEYTCRASNTLLAKPVTSTIQLDMNLLPLETKIVRSPLIVHAGEEQEFVCETRGSRPRALTTWWLEGRKLTSGVSDVSRESGNVTLSTLHLTPQPSDNGKRLICKSANPSMPKATFEDERLLRVQFVPIVKLMIGMGLSRTDIREGSDVYLECSVFANPWIFEISWLFEDKPIVTNSTFGVLVSNQTLILRNVHKDHRGHFRCTANNALGRGYSEHLDLQVQFAPVCRSRSVKTQGLSVSEAVNVTCDTEASPQNVLYRWALNASKGVEEPLGDWSREAVVFSYAPLTEGGYGTLLCWGKNAVGEQKEPCAVRIVPAGAPEPPHDCLITNQTSSSLTVECQAGFDGGLPQLFHAEVYDSVAEHIAANASTADRPRFRVTALSPVTSYVIVAYASNAKGRSTSVALVAATLSPAERRTSNTDEASFSPALGILIAVVVLLFLFTIIIAVVIKLHSTREAPTKDAVMTESPNEDLSKKEIEDCQEGGSSKGPDIIPLSIDPDVFFTGRVAPEESIFHPQNDISSTEYVHEKYTHTVL